MSDTRTPETDESGGTIRAMLSADGHEIVQYAIVPDDPEVIMKTLQSWASTPGIDAIITNGGTGIAARDRTFEAIAGLLTLRLDGFGELFRSLSFQEIGPAAMLSRALGGAIGDRAVFALPGSRNAVRLGMESLILPEVRHVVYELRK